MSLDLIAAIERSDLLSDTASLVYMSGIRHFTIGIQEPSEFDGSLGTVIVRVHPDSLPDIDSIRTAIARLCSEREASLHIESLVADPL